MIRIVEYVFWQWIRWRSFSPGSVFHPTQHKPPTIFWFIILFFCRFNPYVCWWLLLWGFGHRFWPCKTAMPRFSLRILFIVFLKNTHFGEKKTHPPPVLWVKSLWEKKSLRFRSGSVVFSICCVAFFTSSSKGAKVGQRSCALAPGEAPGPSECTWLFPIFLGMKLLEVSCSRTNITNQEAYKLGKIRIFNNLIYFNIAFSWTEPDTYWTQIVASTGVSMVFIYVQAPYFIH